MNPFGATPRCPRCDKLVYAAEQVLGPGRKMYHKPCLTCKSCNKRLDSLSLQEHDSEPYCKQCHLRLFSTRDLRYANLPQSAPRSPPKSSPSSPTRISASPGKLDLASLAGPVKHRLEDDTPIEPPAQPFSFPPVDVPEAIPEADETREALEQSTEPQAPKTPPPLTKRLSIYSRRAASPVYNPDQLRNAASSPSASVTTPTHTPPKTLTNGVSEPSMEIDSSPMGKSISEPPASAPAYATGFGKRIVPMSTGGGVVSIPGPFSPTKRMTQTFTGNGSPTSSAAVKTNYTGQGRFGTPQKLTPTFTGGTFGSPRVECPKCHKAVYHAEGVNAVGKRWHKACLRCTQCSTSLDSTRLADRDGEPYCRACYAKLFGPQGSGYALLGKVG